MLVVLTGLAVVNAGYVYRTRCVEPDGSTVTGWSYRPNDVVPYVGYSRSGCQVDTAVRVGLSALGVWKIGGRTG